MINYFKIQSVCNPIISKASSSSDSANTQNEEDVNDEL